jgi:hypothetical protein
MEAQILLLPSGVSIRSCDFRSHFVPFFVLGHDLIFREFESISGDDFWGLGS